MPPKLKNCITCGYSLRGIRSDVCPECGAATDWYSLTFFDPVEFGRARAILVAAGVPFQHVDAGLGAAGVARLVAGGGVAVHELRIGVHDREVADGALQREGIGPQLPILDRSEHVCPGCGAELPTGIDPVCPSCRTAYRTIDVADESEPERTPRAAVRPPGRRSSRILALFWIAFATTLLSPFLWALMGGSSLLDRGAISIGTWLALSLAYLLTTGKGAPRGHGPGEER